MRRRDFLAFGLAGVSALAAPAILHAQVSSGTPVVNGKRVRRKLSTLANDDPFFEAYGNAIELMHKEADTSPLSWIAQSRTHADFCAHGTLEFLPWHRPYLVMFEHICGALIGDPSFALPYWDWGDNQGRLPQPFFDDGPLNVLSWSDAGNYVGQIWGPVSTVPYRFARADLGMKDDPRIAGDFSSTSLQGMENAPTFPLLSALIENPHGTVHVFTGGNPRFNLGIDQGHFSDGLSPLDPCFWLHHCNVDRIWAQSAIPIADQKASFPDVTKVFSGIFHDESGSPVSPVLSDLFDLDQQDYTYDVMVPSLLSASALAVQNQIAKAQPELMNFAMAKGLVTPSAIGAGETIGKSGPAGITAVGAINRIDLLTKDVADIITGETLRPRRLAVLENAFSIDTRRVYARFKDVKPQMAAEGNLLKVFVDCPYLSDVTPTTDPHFAGLISFFGCSPDRCLPRTVTVDITTPLKYLLDNGSLTPTKVQIQLLSLRGEGIGAPVAEFGDVELTFG